MSDGVAGTARIGVSGVERSDFLLFLVDDAWGVVRPLPPAVVVDAPGVVRPLMELRARLALRMKPGVHPGSPGLGPVTAAVAGRVSRSDS
jgi:hypothetical protein